MLFLQFVLLLGSAAFFFDLLCKVKVQKANDDENGSHDGQPLNRQIGGNIASTSIPTGMISIMPTDMMSGPTTAMPIKRERLNMESRPEFRTSWTVHFSRAQQMSRHLLHREGQLSGQEELL